MTSTKPTTKSAVFVDFDNIHRGLKDLDGVAASAFATNPAKWLHWLEHGMTTLREGEADAPPRAALVRRCYLNPCVTSASSARTSFVRAGFTVVECPPLTAQGKNSADIQLVIDVLDVMDHRTRFDEFIILSGDADFTPLLLRLRTDDRRTTIITAGPSAEAYRAAADRVIPAELFIEFGLDLPGRLRTPFVSHSRSAAASGSARPWPPQCVATNGSGVGVSSSVRPVPTRPLRSACSSDGPPTHDAEISSDEIGDFAERVRSVVEVPNLQPPQFALLFQLIAEEVREHDYDFVRTQRAVRDRSRTLGQPIARRHVSFVLHGVQPALGTIDWSSPDAPDQLAEAFRGSIEQRSRLAGLDLSQAKDSLRRWIANPERA